MHLRKCNKTTDRNDARLAGVNENTVILIDGKFDNYAGYLRMLKFQRDKVKEIEYSLSKDNEGISMISVIFNKKYNKEEFTIRN